MKLISGLLERYRNLVAPDAALKEAFCLLIKERFRTEVLPAAVSVRQGILYMNAGGILKSEIALKKPEILREIEKRTGKLLQDIR